MIVWCKFRNPIFNRFWLIHPLNRQTDRQTYGRTIAYIALCAIAR